MFKITFYNEQEKKIFQKDYDNEGGLFNRIIREFGCDDSKPYKYNNDNKYGYIKTFDCYGRFEITEKKMFKKSDFKNGMVVELDTGDRRLFWENRFIDATGYIPLDYYDDNLNNIDRIPKDENIVKVFNTHNIGYLEAFFDDRYLTEIWSR